MPQGSNLYHQAWQPVPWPTEPSCWPDILPFLSSIETNPNISGVTRLSFMIHGHQCSISLYSYQVVCFFFLPMFLKRLVEPFPSLPFPFFPLSPLSFFSLLTSFFLMLSFFWEMVSWILHWLWTWTHFEAKDDLELRIFLPPSSGITDVQQATHFTELELKIIILCAC